MYLLFSFIVGGIFILWKFKYEDFIVLLYNIYHKLFEKDISAFGEHVLIVKNIWIHKKYGNYPIEDKDVYYYTLQLNILFGYINLHSNSLRYKKIDWGTIDFILINYNLKDRDYSIILTKDFTEIKKDEIPKLCVNDIFKGVLYSHDNDKVDVTNILKRYIGPHKDFYKYLGIEETRDLRYILNDYNLDDYVYLEVESIFGTKKVIYLEDNKIIDWDPQFG